MSFTPDPRRIRRYPEGRQPYVEFMREEQKVHGRVLGWQDEMVLVEYPPRVESRHSYSPRETVWLKKSEAIRLRRADSLWADLEDDTAWHQRQDPRITYRTDPWAIYAQEHPRR